MRVLSVGGSVDGVLHHVFSEARSQRPRGRLSRLTGVRGAHGRPPLLHRVLLRQNHHRARAAAEKWTTFDLSCVLHARSRPALGLVVHSPTHVIHQLTEEGFVPVLFIKLFCHLSGQNRVLQTGDGESSGLNLLQDFLWYEHKQAKETVSFFLLIFYTLISYIHFTVFLWLGG